MLTGVPDSHPTWSPDGMQIAFSRQEFHGNVQIYVMNADGSGQTRLLTATYPRDAHPAWSPNGTRIAFSSDRDGNWGST